ncbi:MULTISPECIES: 4-hydroxy-tetrahydrodipicolinate synthase [Citricoccus]|uniref:4-hydroxy-tetrahydrodipicolinate synthase n=1 Tax=Citricoccus TaxID=169133 RepID=UPI000255DF96|nr:4-hydroxy-tetrahydrodipicolinate synthase [Citricoccus sp. CH26A]
MSENSRFGNVLTAMVTPFDPQGDVDIEGCRRLAQWLTRPGWNDGLVLNGTTGEAFSTSAAEKRRVIETVREVLAPAGRSVIAGVGSSDTRHSVALAQDAEDAGADGLLVVAPYYCRPSQSGLIDYFTAIADSTSLPVIVYDIPKRTGVAVEPETLRALAEHVRIVAVKDAKGDLQSTSWVLKHTGLVYYSGDDALNLPLLSVGASGFISVAGHLAAPALRSMLACFHSGSMEDALGIHRELLPIFTGLFRCPASASVKELLSFLHLPAGPVRSPLVPLSPQEVQVLMKDFEASTACTTAVASLLRPVS